MESPKPLKFLEKIRQKLFEKDQKYTKSHLATVVLNRSKQSLGQYLTKGKTISIDEFSAIRDLAKKAGYNDKQLNDLICDDADNNQKTA